MSAVTQTQFQGVTMAQVEALLQAMRAMQSAPTASPAATQDTPVKRKPGRPRKNPVASPVASPVAPIVPALPPVRKLPTFESMPYKSRNAKGEPQDKSAVIHAGKESGKLCFKLPIGTGLYLQTYHVRDLISLFQAHGVDKLLAACDQIDQFNSKLK